MRNLALLANSKLRRESKDSMTKKKTFTLLLLRKGGYHKMHYLFYNIDNTYLMIIHIIGIILNMYKQNIQYRQYILKVKRTFNQLKSVSSFSKDCMKVKKNIYGIIVYYYLVYANLEFMNLFRFENNKTLCRQFFSSIAIPAKFNIFKEKYKLLY